MPIISCPHLLYTFGLKFCVKLLLFSKVVCFCILNRTLYLLHECGIFFSFYVYGCMTYLFMCMLVHTHVWVCRQACVHVCRDLRLMLDIFLHHISTLFFVAESVTPELTHMVNLNIEFALGIPSSPYAGATGRLTCPVSAHVGSGDPNSGSLALWYTALTTEPSLQPILSYNMLGLCIWNLGLFLTVSFLWSSSTLFTCPSNRFVLVLIFISSRKFVHISDDL